MNSDSNFCFSSVFIYHTEPKKEMNQPIYFPKKKLLDWEKVTWA